MKKMTHIATNESGFTLVEIIAVLVILGILAAVAVPKFFDMQETAEKKTLQSAYNDMASRMNAAFSKSLLDHDGSAETVDFDTFGDLDLDNTGTPLSTIYKDFAGTWDGGGASNITYAAGNGTVTYTFSIGTNGSSTSPADISVSPAIMD